MLKVRPLFYCAEFDLRREVGKVPISDSSFGVAGGVDLGIQQRERGVPSSKMDEVLFYTRMVPFRLDEQSGG